MQSPQTPCQPQQNTLAGTGRCNVCSIDFYESGNGDGWRQHQMLPVHQQHMWQLARQQLPPEQNQQHSSAFGGLASAVRREKSSQQQQVLPPQQYTVVQQHQQNPWPRMQMQQPQQVNPQQQQQPMCWPHQHSMSFPQQQQDSLRDQQQQQVPWPQQGFSLPEQEAYWPHQNAANRRVPDDIPLPPFVVHHAHPGDPMLNLHCTLCDMHIQGPYGGQSWLGHEYGKTHQKKLAMHSMQNATSCSMPEARPGAQSTPLLDTDASLPPFVVHHAHPGNPMLNLHCIMCDMHIQGPYGGQSWLEHEYGKTHQKKLAMHSMQNVTSCSSMPEARPGVQSTPLLDTDASLPPTVARVNGVLNRLWCSICSVEVVGPYGGVSWIVHESGKVHQKNVRLVQVGASSVAQQDEYAPPHSIPSQILQPVHQPSPASQHPTSTVQPAGIAHGQMQNRQRDALHIHRCHELALKSFEEGGCPIGAVLVDAETGQVLGEGHNNLVQEGNPILHGEMSALRAAGRMISRSRTVLYTSLSPCTMCSGAILQFGIPCVVIADSINSNSNEDFLRQHGVTVVQHPYQPCISLVTKFRNERPNLWQEDYGGPR